MTRDIMLGVVSAILGGSFFTALAGLLRTWQRRNHAAPERDKIIVSSAEQTVVTMARVNERTMSLLAERDERIREVEEERDHWRDKARQKDLKIDELEVTCYQLRNQARKMQEKLDDALGEIAKLKRETREEGPR